ncbi:MAG TPA: alpha/beta hydrolase [Spirochaetia bacterium]|nr:alpha/beta hydrolase [Spirochaetia bacterium]
MPTVSIRGAHIHYQIHGTGVPVAFTPGGFWGLDDAVPFAEALSLLGCRVVIHDRPNCGASDIVLDDSRTVYDLFADYLHGLLAELRLLPCVIAGASAGAVTSLAFARRHPESVRGVVLISPPTDDPGAWQAIARSTFQQPARLAELGGMAAVAEISLGFFDFPSRIAANPRNRDALLSMDPKRFAAVLRRWGESAASGREHVAGLSDAEIAAIAAPALVICGPDPRNGLHPRHTAERLHELIAGSRLIVPYEALPTEVVEKVRAQVAEGGGRLYDAALAPFVRDFALSLGAAPA